jgi:tetratricopeptide (TPR) repeat protein
MNKRLLSHCLVALASSYVSCIAVTAEPGASPAKTWLEYKTAGEQAEIDHDYARAQLWYSRALPEAEKCGPHSDQLEETVSRLATSYVMQNKFDAAEPLFKRALDIVLGDKPAAANPDQLVWLDDLADAYEARAMKSTRTGVCFEHAIEIRGKISGGQHSKLGPTLFKLCEYRFGCGHYKDALQVGERALSAFELHEKETSNVMQTLIFIGASQVKLGQIDQGERTLQHAMRLAKKIAPCSQYEAVATEYQAEILGERKKVKEGEALYLQAIKIEQANDRGKGYSQWSGLEHLGEYYEKHGNYPKAAEYFRKEIGLYENRFGNNSNSVATPCLKLAAVLRKMHRESEADKLEARARQVQTPAVSTAHP